MRFLSRHARSTDGGSLAIAFLMQSMGGTRMHSCFQTAHQFLLRLLQRPLDTAAEADHVLHKL